MELSQLEQMVRFLDEERKKDKALINKLQERTEQQSLTIEAQAKEIDALEQEVTTLQGEIRRTDEFPGMVEKARRDLNSEIQTLKEKVRRQKIEADKLRRAEIETLTQELNEIEKRLRVLPRYEEALEARETAEQRLQSRIQSIANDLSDLTKRTEDRLQSLIYLEEQRRADARRISTVEGELPGIAKKTDELQAKLVRLEDSIRKIPGRVDEAIQTVKEYDARIEALRVADFQREQRMRKFLEQAGEVDEEVQRLVEQTQRYTLIYNQTKQALDSLETFRTRLEKRQNEIGEMQRLTEERLKRQWEEWQANFARDWQKRQVAEEDHWRRQDLNNQKTAERLADLEARNKLHYEELVMLWEELRNATERWRKTIEDTISENQAAPTERIKELRRYQEEQRKELP
jgi:chromosome segregation ATPase